MKIVPISMVPEIEHTTDRRCNSMTVQGTKGCQFTAGPFWTVNNKDFVRPNILLLNVPVHGHVYITMYRENVAL